MDAATFIDSYAKTNWQDITQEFKSSVKHLNLGELISCDNFTLLEAMSALELMDPKMDMGMMLKKYNRKIMTLEESIKCGTVKISHLKLEELIGIMDDSYACLATWLEGHFLAQTVMTNLYLHEPERIEDRCLRVFSQSILRIVDFINQLVQRVLCIEEEDFQLNHNFNLAYNLNDHKVLNSLDDVCQHYEKLLLDLQGHNLNSNNQTTNKKQQPPQAPQTNCNQTSGKAPNYDKSGLTAIINRLRFTHNFYACFLNINKNILDVTNVTPQTDATIQKMARTVQTSAQSCHQYLEKCLKYLDNWTKTIDFGIKPLPQEDGKPIEGVYPTIMGFEPLINHKMICPAYPRCPSIKSRPSTLEYLRDLIMRLMECISISNGFSQKSFTKSLDSIEQFSKYSRPSSCVTSRSFILLLYLPARSTKYLQDGLLQSLIDFCEPSIQAMRKDEVSSATLMDFLYEASKSFSQIINLNGHNAARQQERFPDIISSFKNLQYSALVFNYNLNNSTIYSWTIYYLSRLCTKYVLAGLKLELFSSHEYPYVFWYLYDILYRKEREQLELAKQIIFESQIVDDANQKAKIKGNKKQRKKSLYSTAYHDKCLLSIDAHRFLTGGTFLLTYGLKLQGKIKVPVMEFTSEEICFEHRFASLTGTNVYESYKQTLARLEKLEYIYREALECFSEAKDLFSQMGSEYESCLKVCKTNMVVARILSTNLNSLSDREVEFCFDTHPCFPTVKV